MKYKYLIKFSINKTKKKNYTLIQNFTAAAPKSKYFAAFLCRTQPSLGQQCYDTCIYISFCKRMQFFLLILSVVPV